MSDAAEQTSHQMQKPVYLGDGVYAGHDGYQIWLSVGDHEHPTMALDPDTLQALATYAKAMGLVQ